MQCICVGAMVASKAKTANAQLISSHLKFHPLHSAALRGAFNDPCAAEHRGHRGGQDGCQDPNFDQHTGSACAKV